MVLSARVISAFVVQFSGLPGHMWLFQAGPPSWLPQIGPWENFIQLRRAGSVEARVLGEKVGFGARI